MVEEKRQVIEYQLKEELYNWRPDVRPERARQVRRARGRRHRRRMEPAQPERTLAAARQGRPDAGDHRQGDRQAPEASSASHADIAARIDARIALIEAKERALADAAERGADAGERAPWFCSRLPAQHQHEVPEGSRAVAGIGCHYMAIWMDRSHRQLHARWAARACRGSARRRSRPTSTSSPTSATAPTSTSGLLAIRQAIAAGVNITYKILYNDAVAMTGGQPVGDGPKATRCRRSRASCDAEGAAQGRRRHRRAREVRRRERCAAAA